MSDLQCPARLFLAGSSWDGTRGGDAEQVRLAELAEGLRYERVIAVYTCGRPQSRFLAAAAAHALGLASSAMTGADEMSAGESQTDAAARLRDALDGLADLHRGETVLVLCHSSALDALAGQLRLPAPDTEGHDLLEVEVTSQGWHVTRR